MAKFGKLKKFIRKVPASPAPEGDTPGSAPTTPAGALKPAVDLPEMGATPKATNQSEEVHTEADDVLDGILQDLNIKVGQLVVEDAQKADTVSEYSGGSAKSVDDDEGEEEDGDDEEDDDNEEEEGEEDDDDEEVIHKLVSPKNDSKKKHKKTSSVGDRVAAVVAAADEIRERKQRRGTPSPTTTETSKKSGEVTTPLTEPGFPEKKNGAAPATAAVHAPSPSLSKKEQSSRRSSKKEQAPKKSSDGGEKRKSKKQQRKLKEVEEQMKIAVEQQEQPDRPERQSELPPAMPKKEKKGKKGKKSPLLPLMPKSKSRARSATPPGVSPEVQQASDGEGAAPTLEEHQVISKTFDDDDQTKDTLGMSDEGTYDDNTLESHVTHSMSDTLDGSTLEDEQRMLGKKTVMNKDIIIHGPGGPSALVVRAMYYTPLPSNPDDIVIKVEASTVSFRDCLLRNGVGPDKVPFPFVPGCEVVGTISNLGKTAKLEGYRVGDRVVGLTRSGGGNGFYAKLPMKRVAPVLGTTIDAADAVCLVDVYMTAYQALRVGKKDGTPLTEANVLITDGYSPVGQAAVQLAKLEGANVYVTTTESRQDEYMKGLGVRVLPLAPSNWLHKLKGKMDIVIDNTCFDSYDSSWKALNASGVLVCTGTTSLYSFQDHGAGGCGGCDALGDVRDYQARWAKMKAKYMMSQTKFHDLWESFEADPKKYQQELKYLCFLVESGMLKPKISERVSIEEVPDAQRYLETGKANGTIVCLP